MLGREKERNKKRNAELFVLINVQLAKKKLSKTEFCRKHKLAYKTFMAVFSGLKKTFNDDEFDILESFLQKDLTKYKIHKKEV